jgi:ATP-dependent protease ClpP protease subunit
MIFVKSETKELFIDGIIGASWTGDGVTAAMVGEALGSMSGRATIRINSPGGSADEGVAIYNLLRRHPGGVDTHNEALAASAASIIFLAGENRTMERGSKLMIHNAHMVAIGNKEDLRKSAEILSAYDRDMADIYAEHMKASRAEIEAAMAEETWYSVQDAVDIGLATAVASTLKTKKAAAAAWFKHPPQDLFEEAASEKKAEAVKRFNVRHWEREVRQRLSKQ